MGADTPSHSAPLQLSGPLHLPVATSFPSLQSPDQCTVPHQEHKVEPDVCPSHLATSPSSADCTLHAETCGHLGGGFSLQPLESLGEFHCPWLYGEDSPLQACH